MSYNDEQFIFIDCDKLPIIKHVKNNKLGFINSLYKIKQKQSIKDSILGKLTCSISKQIPKDKTMKFAIKGTDFCLR